MTEEKEAAATSEMPLTGHLEELRIRLIRCFVYVSLGFVACYSFKEDVFKILTHPLISVMPEGGKLIFTGLPEPFFVYLKVSFFAGLVVAMPLILWEVWRFVTPGLVGREAKVLFPLVFLSCLFFAIGGAFGYFVVFPFGFKFLLGFGNETVQALPSMKEYLSFAMKLLLAFGLVFELPLFLTVFASLGLVTPEFLKKNRKYAILIFFVGAAILTPPDVVTQIMMALPLMLLYEISILGAKVFGRKPLGEGEEASEKKRKKKKKKKSKNKDVDENEETSPEEEEETEEMD